MTQASLLRINKPSRRGSIQETRGEQVFHAFNLALMQGLALITIYPLLHVLFSSFSDPGLLMKTKGLVLFPKGFTVKAYQIVFKNPDIVSGYINTILYMGSGTVLSMALTILGAYAFSRSQAIWTKYLVFFAAFTMWFKPSMIPFFLTISRDMGMKNTFWSMILPRAIGTYNLMVLRTGFAVVPSSLEESARIDGANDFTILLRIYLPLCLANLAVVTLFYMVAKWNAWFDAMLFLNQRSMFPLQLLLREILILNSTDSMLAASTIAQGDQIPLGETIKYATIVIATVPILCVYPFIQKYFVKGVMIGAIKG
jgi:putative aldouronate transport system permease protein